MEENKNINILYVNNKLEKQLETYEREYKTYSYPDIKVKIL